MYLTNVPDQCSQTCIIVITQIFATVGIVATASRMLWAFAREGGLPGSKWISRVSFRLPTLHADSPILIVYLKG